MAIYTCAVCGVTVKRSPSANKAASGLVYCSPRCNGLSRGRHGLHVACALCGALVYRTPSGMKRSAVYCSRVCSNRAHSLRLQGHPIWVRTNGLRVSCLQCNREFAVKPYRAERVRYCSRACAYAYRRGKPGPPRTRDIYGAKNPNYRGTSNQVTARAVAQRLHSPWRLALHDVRLGHARRGASRPVPQAWGHQRPGEPGRLVPEPPPHGPPRLALPRRTQCASSCCSCCTTGSPTPV